MKRVQDAAYFDYMIVLQCELYLGQLVSIDNPAVRKQLLACDALHWVNMEHAPH